MTEPNRLALRENKVPEPTASFWAIKILATTVGETAADHCETALGLNRKAVAIVSSRISSSFGWMRQRVV